MELKHHYSTVNFVPILLKHVVRVQIPRFFILSCHFLSCDICINWYLMISSSLFSTSIHPCFSFVRVTYIYDCFSINKWAGINRTSLHVYNPNTCLETSLTCFCLATIDQYFATCSHPRWQQFYNIKLAQCLVIASVLIWILHGIPLLVYYDHIQSRVFVKDAKAHEDPKGLNIGVIFQ